MTTEKKKPTTAYPLSWPEGWKRTAPHLRGDGRQFGTGTGFESDGAGGSNYVGKRSITLEVARQKLREALDKMKATFVTLSTNVPLRNDGEPRSDGGRAPHGDPGVAIYFTLKGKPMVMATDAFDNVASNVRSLGLAIEAMRQLERHGGGQMMERAFTGFSALPPPDNYQPRRPWWEVLRYPEDPAEREILSVAEIEARWKALAKKLHPDGSGASASDAAMSELNVAREDAVKEIEGREESSGG